MQEFYLNSGDIRLHCCIWKPKQTPVAILQIIHGVAEYTARYDDFASYLADHGILVVGEDHPGHGKTETPENTLGYMSGGWFGTVEGIHLLRTEIGAQYPDLPYFMLGHSMGSFLLRTYLTDKRCKIAGAILSGTAWQPSALLGMGKLICRAEAARLGNTATSKLLQTLIFDGYNKKFSPVRTSCDWLSCDEKTVDAYVDDPLCGFPSTVQLCSEMFTGLAYIQKQENIDQIDPAIPVFFVAGAQDPVGDMGKGVLRTARAFQKASVQDMEIEIYPGMRHEILNEIDKMTVYHRIFNWICTRNVP